jgi:hypothetical protein
VNVLVHYPPRSSKAVGVWWLPAHRSVPQGFYLDQSYYNDGARMVLGLVWDGTPFTQGQWESRVERLTESANPRATWSVYATQGDPRELLFSH